ncbi:MAG: DUF2125 domain-containing protein [Litoreibacter sp.]|nr:DUF2125 domain-containing protein [Litoreibacter sp.]
MRKLLGLIIVAAIGWSVYWFIGAEGHKAAMTTWLDDRRAEGWQVEYTDHTVAGFPNRFDTSFTDLRLTDPETGLSWQAPFFQILSLSYQPNHLIAVWPNEQIIATPRERFTLKTSGMRASIKVKPSTTLELDNAQVEVSQAEIASSEGWTSRFNALNGAIRNVETGEPLYDVAANIDQFQPADPIRNFIDRDGTLPDVIEEVRFDLNMELAGPLDRIALEDGRPDVTGLTIRDARAAWGELELRMNGEMFVENTVPNGEVNITARNWKEMLALAVQTGALDGEAARAAEFALSLLAASSGGENSLDATLNLSRGAILLGPIPVGPAPRIALP